MLYHLIFRSDFERSAQGQIVKVMFKGDVAGEGIISDTVQQFNVQGNFLHGSIEYIQEQPLGIFMMELIGKDEDIHKAIAYMKLAVHKWRCYTMGFDFSSFYRSYLILRKHLEKQLLMISIALRFPL